MFVARTTRLPDNRADGGSGRPPPDGLLVGHLLRSARRKKPRRDKATAAKGKEILYTAVLAVNDGERVLHAFHAALVADEASMRTRVQVRLGERAAAAAIVKEGFDPSHPLVLGMVSEAIAEILAFADADPGSLLAAGLDVQLEQRFC